MAHSKNLEKNALKLSDLPGVSGHEEEVTKYIKNNLSTLKKVKFDKDNLGSLAVIKKGSLSKNAPIISIVAHADEVGFMLSNILPTGYLKFEPLGGWWGHVLLGQIVTVHTRSGKKIKGIVGSTPPHVLKPEQVKAVVSLEQMYIDIGAKDIKEVEKMGISIGDVIVPESKSWVMPNKDYIVGKALDDRVGVAICMEVMKKIANINHEADVIFVASTQEEVGLRGAKTSSYKWTPDVSFAIDVTISNDQPGMEKKPSSIGSGVALSLFDRSVISNPKLRKKVEDIAKKYKIPYTFDGLAAGGTDAGAIHLTKDGVVTMTLSIPSRYIHSHNSLVSLSDMQATVDLIVNFIKDFKKSNLSKLK